MRTTTGCSSSARAHLLLGQCRRGGARTAAGGLASPPARGAARPQTKTPSPASSRASSRMETDEGEAMLSGHKDPSRHAIGKGSRSALQVRARRDKVEKKESAEARRAGAL